MRFITACLALTRSIRGGKLQRATDCIHSARAESSRMAPRLSSPACHKVAHRDRTFQQRKKWEGEPSKNGSFSRKHERLNIHIDHVSPNGLEHFTVEIVKLLRGGTLMAQRTPNPEVQKREHVGARSGPH